MKTNDEILKEMGAPESRVCPIMTTFTSAHDAIIRCIGPQCQLWIEVYTTEGERHRGCSFELQPQMSGGLFRV